MAIPTFSVGQRLTVSLITDSIVAYIPTTPVIKGTATNRNSGGTGTTLTNDPELLGISLGVGTWSVYLQGFWTQTTTTTQKIKTRWAFTGTWNSPPRACYGAGFTQTAGPSAATESTWSAYTSDGQDAIYDQAAGGTFGVFIEESSNVVVTAAGTLSLQWAQQTASANNTSLQPGSAFTIRKISA